MKNKLEEHSLDIVFVCKEGFKGSSGYKAVVDYWRIQSQLNFNEYEAKRLLTYHLRETFKDLARCYHYIPGLLWSYQESLDNFRRYSKLFLTQEEVTFGEEIYALFHTIASCQIRERYGKILKGINGFTNATIRQTRKRLKELAKLEFRKEEEEE